MTDSPAAKPGATIIWDVAHKNVRRTTEPFTVPFDERGEATSARMAATRLLSLLAGAGISSQFADYLAVPMEVLGMGEGLSRRVRYKWDEAISIGELFANKETAT